MDFFSRNGLTDKRNMPLLFRDASGRMIETKALGNDGQGGGGSFTFTGKYAISVFNYFNNGGSMSGLSFGDTEVTWYTGTATQDAYRMGDDIYSDIDLGGIHRAKISTQSFVNLSLIGNINDGLGGFAEGLSYNGNNGGKLYIGTARLNKPINLGFTKFYGNGKTYINPSYMGKVGNVLGKASIAATVIIGGVNIYNGVQQDGGTFGHNATKATTGTVGGAIGAWGGATLGAEIGAGIGVWFGGVGAAPGALIGGVIGGIAGGIIGTKTGEGVIY